jgi:hypothetical protein
MFSVPLDSTSFDFFIFLSSYCPIFFLYAVNLPYNDMLRWRATKNVFYEFVFQVFFECVPSTTKVQLCKVYSRKFMFLLSRECISMKYGIQNVMDQSIKYGIQKIFK